MGKIFPKHYNIHLEPDLSNFTFQGKVNIQVECQENAKQLILNALDLDIKQCLVKFDNSYQEAKFKLNLENQELVIDIPGDDHDVFDIKIHYLGEINDKLTGFYRSKYVINGEEKFAAVTQFEESDARRAFPCFDHPSMKATFDIEMLVDANLITISNNTIQEEKELENNKKLVKFHRTPRMSTYLIFFAVGEFETIEEKLGDIDVRVLASPGKVEKYGKFGLDFAVKSLKYCLEYYDIDGNHCSRIFHSRDMLNGT